ncbi:4-hydroxy-tetrahydrodipicolinate reductase [Chloroflexota bacterium]
MNLIRVVVNGASGRMGQEVINALCHEPEMKIVGAAELKVTKGSLSLPDVSESIPFSSNLEQLIIDFKPDVLVDFTTATAVMPTVRISAKHNVNMVIGTTGLTNEDISEIEQLSKAHQIGIIVAPNFAIGAILMTHMAKIASKYLDHAEIIELHHNLKIDAPSGTALNTARIMAASKGKPFSQNQEKQNFESRGYFIEGIPIHSVRLPGLMAHQEVIFGTSGQTLRIRHDTINRECYMPGTILAIKEVVKRQGLTYGLDSLLNL